MKTKINDIIVRKTTDGFEIVTTGDTDVDIDIITERLMDGIYRLENFRPVTKKNGRFIMKEAGYTLCERLFAKKFYMADVVTDYE